MSCDLGIYGLAVMGLGLSLNIASKGFKVCVCNRTRAKVDLALQRAKEEDLGEQIVGAKNVDDFIQALKKPRRIMMVIEAGAPVDALIEHLLPKLESGDCLVDAGNEFFEVSEKREKLCSSKGVLFMDVGLCAGEDGARYGPPLTPGGTTEAWAVMEPILIHMAGKIDPLKNVPAPGSLVFTEEERKNACVTHLGPCGAGHYVKMVHNGIMYGDMQLIAEAYHLLKYACGLTNEELGETFRQWGTGELRSYLLEITSQIVSKKDGLTGGYLLDYIVDSAGSRGTGKWTMQEAANLGVAVPTITAAQDMRYISSNLPLRSKMDSTYARSWPSARVPISSRKQTASEDIRRAFACARICCFAQGMQLLRAISKEKGWALDFSEISRIWQAGCVIQCDLLSVLQEAFLKDPSIENVLLDEKVSQTVKEYLPSLQQVLAMSLRTGDENGQPVLLPLASHAASYFYIAANSGLRLSINLVQAQRDCFGAHHFKRIDREGKFHEDNWAE
ncbi:6-phosphogluconate dehydrogenase [Cystoisospora suis]|uniref:6-phosphogluconate dehydrogenase, decarboxylating n=1 Tax=Cystoisospora suis TaxID=483139 RepID=A0A2C6LB65_9APIC|nr:6-phosphogluconate dehydrogenase [Cystoisospora suis]